ncbi:MAG TPA: UDP-N-acetylmuramoyl-L-alanine--D-glutamate ligase [Rhodocyclaceae bacterium]|nr:UDP-N-acetylmuramoyl-L-alanine--D-glutamate ligase [Rhodocyclaceae bacterium]
MNLKGRHVLILGLGESGFAMVRWCVRLGARVSVADSRAAPANRDAALALGATVTCGAQAFASLSLLDGVDLVALSPGLAKADPLPQAALARGLPLWSEIEFFAAALRDLAPASQVLAITGSNGKTTTTALTAALVNAAGLSAIAAGNISPAALDALMAVLDGNTMPAVWVLELSSFQLETTQSLNAAGATVLNVSEDHLDRYRDMDDYAAAKARVFLGAAVAVLNREDPRVMAMGAALADRQLVSFGLDPAPGVADFGVADGWLMHGTQRLLPARELGLTGSHNVANALAALALCQSVGIEPAAVLDGLRQFKGLPHRVEWVAAENGVDYYDDSKGTNVGATLAALQGMGRKVAIILGGDGKGQDFSPLKAALVEHGRAVALIGRDADAIAAAIAGCGVPTRRCADMAEAVAYCRAAAQAGDAVLLSPACASLDMYRNYAHRAEVFIAAVKAQIAGAPC